MIYDLCPTGHGFFSVEHGFSTSALLCCRLVNSSLWCVLCTVASLPLPIRCSNPSFYPSCDNQKCLLKGCKIVPSGDSYLFVGGIHCVINSGLYMNLLVLVFFCILYGGIFMYFVSKCFFDGLWNSKYIVMQCWDCRGIHFVLLCLCSNFLLSTPKCIVYCLKQLLCSDNQAF